MNRLCLRLRAWTAGGHTHVGVWVGLREKMPQDDRFSDLGKSGELVFRNEEWLAFRAALALITVAYPDAILLLITEDGGGLAAEEAGG